MSSNPAKPEPYDLDEMIKLLEECSISEDSAFHLARAIYTLALEIRCVRDSLETLSNHYYDYDP